MIRYLFTAEQVQEIFREIIIGCAIASATGCATYVGQLLNYCRDFNEKVETLKSRLEELCGWEVDIKTNLHKTDVQEGEKRKTEVEVWQNNVKRIKKEVGELEMKVAERSFLSLLKRPWLGKLVKKKIKEVAQLREKGNFSDGVSTKPLSSGNTLPTTPLVGTTAERTQKQILDWLEDPKIGKIGVWGMGGIGKTSTMQHINNHLKENKVFKNIIWATVSKAFDIKKLQSDIAKSIEIELPEDEYEESRATKLHSTLMRQENFLLILDDLWEAFPLEKIGIPEPNEGNRCKIALTTRSLKVCAGMGTHRDIKAEVLSEDEAWELFKDKVGNNAILSLDVEDDIAKQVVKECGRLPLAIITVGRALSKVEDVRVWRNALNELKNSSTGIGNMENDVFRHLKFSFDRLKSEKFQACFLYCALYPEDREIPVSELIEYWICEGLIDDGYREARYDKGHAILNELKYVCMLEGDIIDHGASDFEKQECIKMHDLIRDLAVNITKTKPQFMVKAGIGLKKAPEDEEWTQNIERISLMHNKIEFLTNRPKCPKLSTLLLQQNDLRSISYPFFKHMHSLRVVDLSRTNIESLPKSLFDLVNLRALVLSGCSRLQKLPSLAKLRALRVLDLSYSGITELPKGIEMLTKLTRLHLCYLQILFPFGIIPKLLLLEDLSLYRNTSLHWETIIEEITRLKNLSSLKLSFPEFLNFSKYVKSGQWKLLESFAFTIGNLPYSFYNIPSTGQAHICNIIEINMVRSLDNTPSLVVDNWNSTIDEIECSSITLPHNTLVLQVQNWNTGDPHSWELLCLSNLRELKVCRIWNCRIEWFLTSVENTLPNLEKLFLYQLNTLSGLCKVVMPPDTFSSLKKLDVSYCHRLKNLLSLRMLQHLIKLETIIVQYCIGMETIFGGGQEEEEQGSNNNTIIVPKLLLLEDLSLYRNYSLSLHWETIIEEITRLTNLSSLQLSFPEFLTFSKYVKSGHWKLLESFAFSIWKVPYKSRIRRWKNSVYIRNIDINMVRSLDNTPSLVVDNWNTDDEIECSSSITLPHNTLSLFVERWDTGDPHSWELLCLSNLRQLKVCYIRLSRIEWFLTSVENTLPNLQELQLRWLYTLSGLCKVVMPRDTFSSLKKLAVSYCPKLKNLLSFRMLQHLIKLETITVQSCNGMETVFGGGQEEEEQGSNNNNTITLPNLENIEFGFLKNLTSICSKVLVCNSLSSLVVYACCKLKKLRLSGAHLSPAIQGKIRGNKDWWDSLEWDDPIIKTRLQPLYNEVN